MWFLGAQTGNVTLPELTWVSVVCGLSGNGLSHQQTRHATWDIWQHLWHSATVKYIAVWMYHCFSILILCPNPWCVSYLITYSNTFSFKFQSYRDSQPFIIQGNWFIESGTYVLSDFEVFARFICTLPLLAVIPACSLICVSNKTARSLSAKTMPY